MVRGFSFPMVWLALLWAAGLTLPAATHAVSQVSVRADAAPWPPQVSEEARAKPPGLLGPVGPRGQPRRVKTLDITEKGVYEDYLVDQEGGARTEVIRIKADGAVLRNCEIRNGTRDGVGVHAADVLIENCRIHHFLAQTFKEQKDAHGITGRPTRLTIRNCEIYYVSGDAVQFDPARKPWTDVLIENCDFWTGPLPADAAGFRKGEQPGENAVDTKQLKTNPRSRMVIRNSVFHGFLKGGQISNMAALNLKNNVDVRVENCAFWDNEICLRLRGEGTKADNKYGGAHVTVQDCSFYTSDLAVRYEDKIEDLKLTNLAFGAGVKQKVRCIGGQGRGFESSGERQAPPLADLLKPKP